MNQNRNFVLKIRLLKGMVMFLKELILSCMFHKFKLPQATQS